VSQVYGGGGNASAVFLNDFIELFNRTSSPVPVDGWSIQYASATGTGLFSANVTALAGTIPTPRPPTTSPAARARRTCC